MKTELYMYSISDGCLVNRKHVDLQCKSLHFPSMRAATRSEFTMVTASGTALNIFSDSCSYS